MIELVEFLLAEIVKDEASLKWEHMIESVTDDFDYVQDAHIFLASGLDGIPPMTRPRLLADLATKRSIVEEVAASQDPTYLPKWKGCGDDCEWKVAVWVLKNLAVPYADRPGYQEEWRP